MIIILAIAALLVLAMGVIILAQPRLPKKYPIFQQVDRLEDQFMTIVGQLRSIVDDAFSLYTTYNATAYAQLTASLQQKLSQLTVSLDAFDKYYEPFIRTKTEKVLAEACRAYSTARRQQLAGAALLVQDAQPFMQITLGIRKLRQDITNSITHISPYDEHPNIGVIDELVAQQTAIAAQTESLQPVHPLSKDYRNYISTFLKEQAAILSSCKQQYSENPHEGQHTLNLYADGWSRFNDSHVVDLLHDEFSWKTDAYLQALQDLRLKVDYDE